MRSCVVGDLQPIHQSGGDPEQSGRPGKRTPKDFRKETFGRYSGISLGGADTPETQINKAKAPAEKALGRL